MMFFQLLRREGQQLLNFVANLPDFLEFQPIYRPKNAVYSLCVQMHSQVCSIALSLNHRKGRPPDEPSTKILEQLILKA